MLYINHISLSNETFHAVFGHSHHIIEMNDCKGLGQLSESRLEAKQKFVRRYRNNLTGKTGQDPCMTDNMNRLYTGTFINCFGKKNFSKLNYHKRAFHQGFLILNFFMIIREFLGSLEIRLSSSMTLKRFFLCNEKQTSFTSN